LDWVWRGSESQSTTVFGNSNAYSCYRILRTTDSLYLYSNSTAGKK
jgi:hypothetical protein